MGYLTVEDLEIIFFFSLEDSAGLNAVQFKNSISIIIGLSAGTASEIQCIKCHLTVPINSGS